MNSDIYIKRSLLYRTYDIQYSVELNLPDNKSEIQKFAWKLLHYVLPREVRTGGVVTNLKGLKYNNIILNELEIRAAEYEDLLYELRGTKPQDEQSNLNDGEDNDNFFYTVKSEFLDFLNKKNIRYKSNIFHDGDIIEFINSPVFVFNEKIEIDKLFFGLEFFKPSFFAYIGFAPKIKQSLVVQCYKQKLFLRLRAEQVKTPSDFLQEFSEIGSRLSQCFTDLAEQNIEADYQLLLNLKISGHT